MTCDELRAIADEGVEGGSHTSAHPHLTRLGDAELRREPSDSTVDLLALPRVSVHRVVTFARVRAK